MITKSKNTSNAYAHGAPKKSICFVAGKSGGHIIPCLTKAYELLKSKEWARVQFFSTSGQLDTDILKDHQQELTITRLPACSPRLKKWWRLPQCMLQMCYAFSKSFFTMLIDRPAKVISMGEILSIPVCIAAWLLRIEIELYELNVVPGKTIQFLAPFSNKINCCFEETLNYLPQNKCIRTQYPIRFSQKLSSAKPEAKSPKKTILILGGSQGSLFINNCIKTWLDEDQLGHNYYIIHQTGSNDATDWKTWYADRNIATHVFSFDANMQNFYAQADLIICRSGSGTLHEVAFFAKPCITIPIQTDITDHQKYNAMAMAQKYTFITMLEESEIRNDTNLFKQTVEEIIYL